MGWMGITKSIEASIKRSKRESQKREKAIVKMQLIAERKREFMHASDEVNEFESYIDGLTKLHTTESNHIDWASLNLSAAPQPPTLHYINKESAIDDYKNFMPNFFQKLFKRTNKIKKLLEREIVQAERVDKQNYQQALEKFTIQIFEWKSDVKLANKVLGGDEESFAYILNKRSALPTFSSKFTLELKEDKSLSICVYINAQKAIPTEMKMLLKSGKVTIKPMPKIKYHELYQDHVCSIVLKVARDIFALLPIEKTIITVFDHTLTQSTGYLNDTAIVSARITKETMNRLNLNKIDPSEALKNFTHTMSFKKTSGFYEVEILKTF